MGNDYAYISLLDPDATLRVKWIQNTVCGELGKLGEQWPPHVTLSRGNLLSAGDLVEVVKAFSNLTLLCPLVVPTEGFVVKRKNENSSSLRILLKSTPELLSLAQKVFSATDRFETPIRNPVNTAFHITLVSTIENEEIFRVEKLIENASLPEAITLDSLSIFYSTFNEDRPDMAYEVKKIAFSD